MSPLTGAEITFQPVLLNLKSKTWQIMKQKLDYIHNNPVEAGIVDKAEEFLYSSARDYHGTSRGLIEIKFIE